MDLFLGLHPWLAPLYLLVAAAGLALVAWALVTETWAGVFVGGFWFLLLVDSSWPCDASPQVASNRGRSRA
ncbi:MAG: hypothetical protein ACJ735_00250 [Actinomycetes bacterium]